MRYGRLGACIVTVLMCAALAFAADRGRGTHTRAEGPADQAVQDFKDGKPTGLFVLELAIASTKDGATTHTEVAPGACAGASGIAIEITATTAGTVLMLAAGADGHWQAVGAGKFTVTQGSTIKIDDSGKILPAAKSLFIFCLKGGPGSNPTLDGFDKAKGKNAKTGALDDIVRGALGQDNSRTQATAAPAIYSAPGKSTYLSIADKTSLAKSLPL